MFDFLFDPTIEEKNEYYIIKGVPFHAIATDFQLAYGSSYISSAMMKKINSYSFRIHKFFMVEFHYTLLRVIHNKRLRTPLDKLVKLQYIIENETWFKSTLHPKIIDKFDQIKDQFVFKAKDMQEQFLRTYFSIKESYLLKGLLLDAAPGSGKSLASLMWSEMVGAPKKIILCPDGIVFNVWVAEIKKHFKKARKVWTTQDGTDIDNDAEFIVIHYAALSSSWGPRLEKWIGDQVKKHKQGMSLVVDECHNFNDEKSNRSQIITRWGDMGFFSDSLPMSGTPLKAAGRECYTVFTLIDTLFTSRARDAFIALYGRSRENLNELLRHRIGRGKFTIPSIDGMGETPPVHTISVQIPNAEKYTLKNVSAEMMLYIEERIKFYYQYLDGYNRFFWECVNEYGQRMKDSPYDYKNYERYTAIVKRFKANGFRSFSKEDVDDNKFCGIIEEDIISYLPKDKAKQFKNILSAVKYLGLKIRGEALGNVLGKMRIEATTALIRYAGIPDLIRSAKKKTLLFTSYVDTVKYLEAYLESEGFQPACIFGETNSNRDAILKLLTDNPRVNPGCATFKSLKEGTPCIFANQLILCNAPFRDYELTQVLARVWRRGQDSECFFWLLSIDTGDEVNIASRSIDIMKWSAEQVDQLMSKAAGYGGNTEFSGLMGAEVFEAPWVLIEDETQPLHYEMNALDLF